MLHACYLLFIMCLCMSVKSSTELMLYVVLTMPTLNKAYLFIYLFITEHFVPHNVMCEYIHHILATLNPCMRFSRRYRTETFRHLWLCSRCRLLIENGASSDVNKTYSLFYNVVCLNFSIICF